MPDDGAARPILLVEDTTSLRMVYESVLVRAGHMVASAADAAAGLATFTEVQPEIVLLDLVLPDRDGIALLGDILAERPETAVIVITANGSINRAVEAMRAGAFEFLVKPFDEDRLLAAIENARGYKPRRRGLQTSRSRNRGFIGSSGVMEQVYAMIESVSRSMATVFISGESGTGKEIAAEAIHRASPRSRGPFITLNCGAIPADLLESEVFGHLKGSFTGAISDKIGAAAAADGGTLFLDEICEMHLNLQTKLLRFLQTSTIQPVGAVSARKLNVRIICATNRNAADEVRRGRFRQDLYYRLHVVPIHLPPLRDRGQDVIEIAEAMLAEFSAEEGRAFTGLDPEVKTLFRASPWPGNVRQLLNVLRNVVVLNDGSVVTRAMLPIDILQIAEAAAEPEAAQFSSETSDQMVEARTGAAALIGMTLAEIERIVIGQAIENCGGSIPKAAQMLDISPSTIYRKREGWGEA